MTQFTIWYLDVDDDCVEEKNQHIVLFVQSKQLEAKLNNNEYNKQFASENYICAIIGQII